MMRFESQRDRVLSGAEADYQRSLKAAEAGMGLSPMQALTGGGQATGRYESLGRDHMADARQRLLLHRDQVFTSVRPIAQRIAGQPIRLAIIAGKPGKRRSPESRDDIPAYVKSLANLRRKANEDITIVDQHPILDALHQPAPSIPGWTNWHLIVSSITSLEVTGYAYWWFPEVNGRKEIYFVPSPWMRPHHETNQMFAAWIMRPDRAAAEITLPADSVVPFWYPDPANPFESLAPLVAGARTILTDSYVVEAQKRAFELGIHPAALIYLASGQTTDGKPIRKRLHKRQIDQMREAILQRYRGVVNFGQPMLIDALIDKMEPWGNTPKQMDFGGNMDKTQARVEQTFGTHPYIAGAAGLGSRAESGEADRHFCLNTVNPKIEMLSRVLTLCVVPQFDTSGRYVLFIEPARPRDSEMEQKEWEDGLKYCCVTVNEYRTNVLRLPPVPGGDVVVMPSTSAFQSLPAPTVSPDTEDEEEAEGDEAAKRGRPFRLKARTFTKADGKAHLDGWLKRQEAVESDLAGAMLKLFEEMGESVAEKLQGYGDEQITDQASVVAAHCFDPAAWTHRITSTAQPFLGRAMAQGAAHELDAFTDGPVSKDADAEPSYGLSFDFGVDLPPDILTGVEKGLRAMMGEPYWATIGQTTLGDLTNALQTGIDAGTHPRELAKDVQSVFGGTIGKDRAQGIARTESAAAMNAGQHVAHIHLADQGIIEGREWASTHDLLTRETHYAADGERRKVDESFDVGGYQARFPGDWQLPAKERVRCRCTCLPVTIHSESA